MARQTTLNVSLTAHLRNYVRGKVKSGSYESASEVIRDSLRALQERERAADEAYWQVVREKVAGARREVAGGKGLDGETVMAEIIADAGGDSERRRSTRKTSKRAPR